MKTFRIAALFGLALSLGACAGEEAAAGEGAAVATPAAAPAAPAAAAPAAEPTGNVIEVKMVTEGANSYFEPASVTAKQGDVIRFVNVSGVHNVSFPAAKNAGLSGLPAPSQYLTAANQSYEVPVNMGAGSYTFQCDPHVAMGMVGTLVVE